MPVNIPGPNPLGEDETTCLRPCLSVFLKQPSASIWPSDATWKEYRLNIDGTYITEDGNYTVVIRDSNEDSGTFQGDYIARGTPQGDQSFGIAQGSWDHVGGSKLPVNMGFIVHVRPEGRPWVMRDSWVGNMPGGEGLCMIGSRSYLPAQDRPELSELGTHSFILRPAEPSPSLQLLPCNSTPTLEKSSMFIHEVTGTYLQVRGYVDNIGVDIRTWNQDPPIRGFEWVISATDDHYCLLKSSENKRCVTIGGSASDNPRVQACTNTFIQQWHFVAIKGRPDTFAIIPRNFPDHALGIQNNVSGNGISIVPTRMWGAPNIFQYWRQRVSNAVLE
jgi:hypothetical protein